MALMAEELVEEWLRRQGFFTIRGIKISVQELDLLAVRLNGDTPECWHVEVQASIRPVSYLTPWTKPLQKKYAIQRLSQKKRTPEEMSECIEEWVKHKFHQPRKVALRHALVPALEADAWQPMLVVNNVKFEDELTEVSKFVQVRRLADLVLDLANPGTAVASAAGGDFANLVQLGRELSSNE